MYNFIGLKSSTLKKSKRATEIFHHRNITNVTRHPFLLRNGFYCDQTRHAREQRFSDNRTDSGQFSDSENIFDQIKLQSSKLKRNKFLSVENLMHNWINDLLVAWEGVEKKHTHTHRMKWTKMENEMNGIRRWNVEIDEYKSRKISHEIIVKKRW